MAHVTDSSRTPRTFDALEPFARRPAHLLALRQLCKGKTNHAQVKRSLTRRVLCTERTAASTPARRTERGTRSRRKWWSCRTTRSPTPPRWSAASTPWCSRSATCRAWTAGISPRSPPRFPTEAPRRWNRTRKLKNKGRTGRKWDYRGPFFCCCCLSLCGLCASWKNCGCAVEAAMSAASASVSAANERAAEASGAHPGCGGPH